MLQKQDQKCCHNLFFLFTFTVHWRRCWNVSLLPTYSLNVKETRVFSVKAGGEISNMHWPIDETCPAFYFPEGGFSEPIRSVIPGENYPIVSPFISMAVCWLAQEPLEVCDLLSTIFACGQRLWWVSLLHTFRSPPNNLSHNNVMSLNNLNWCESSLSWLVICFTSKQICWWILMWEDNKGWTFHWRNYGQRAHILARSNFLKVRCLNDGFVSYKHVAFHFTRC